MFKKVFSVVLFCALLTGAICAQSEGKSNLAEKTRGQITSSKPATVQGSGLSSKFEGKNTGQNVQGNTPSAAKDSTKLGSSFTPAKNAYNAK